MTDGVKSWRAPLLATAVLLLAGCSLLPPWRSADLPVALPASWSGDLSCPGCTAQVARLTLLPDGRFYRTDRFSGTAPQGRDELFGRDGQWTWQPGSRRLILHTPGLSPRYFRWHDGAWQLLGQDGEPLRSIKDYLLTRENPPRWALREEPERDDADVMNWITACALDTSWWLRPPALLAESRPLLTAPDVLGPVLPVAPVRDSRCHAVPPMQPLLETTWRVQQLGTQPVERRGVQEQAWLRLRQDGRVQGHTGCNRLHGRFLRQHDQLQFSRLGMTRMSCRGSAAVQEQALVESLKLTMRYQVSGQTLELLDSQSHVLARLQVQEMP